MWQQIKDVWSIKWAEYCEQWKVLWNDYKSIIIPFIKGTALYIYQIINGLFTVVLSGIYESGKIIVKKIIDLIVKA